MASSSRRLFGQGCRVLMAAAKSSSATTTTTTTSAGGAAATKVKKAAKLNGIVKPSRISPALGNFLGGVSEVSRTEAIKKTWDYIKLHNLQNPANKREIFCDTKLKTIFGKDQVGFLEISKLLSPHFVKPGQSLRDIN